jgi:phage tail sheath protein FI
MTVPVSSPGVYIEEIPSSAHTVTGVSTSATAFVDYFPRGPVNQATQVDNWNDFQRIFGGIDTRSEASYGVYQFFLNGGQTAWIIRLVDEASPTPALTAAAAATISVTSPGGSAQTSGAKVDVAWTTNGTVPPGATPSIATSINGGQSWVPAIPWGSPPSSPQSSPPGSPSIMLPTATGVAMVRVTLADASGKPIASGTSASFLLLPAGATVPGVTVTATAPTSPPSQSGGLPLTVTWAAPTTAPDTYAILVSTDDGVTFAPVATNAILASTDDGVTFAPVTTIPGNVLTAKITKLPATGATSVLVQVVARDALGNPLAAGTSSAVALPGTGQPPAAPVANSFQITAANPGVWGNYVVVTLSPGNGAGTFNLTAQAVANGRILQTESFSNLTSTNPNSGSYVTRVLSTAQLVRGIAPKPASGATGVWLTPPTQTIGLGFSGGSDGDPSVSGGQLISKAYDTGNPLASLDDIAPSVFNILCMPAIATLDPSTQIMSISAQAIKFCEDHKAFFLVDIPPATTNVDAMKKFANDAALTSQDNIHGAVYYPRLVMPDPVNGYRPRNVGASGTLAGVYARNDTQAGVWVAPAGTTAVLQGATLAVQTTDAENGQLNPLGINCLRTFPIFGNISWGARTLAGADQIDSQWKYIPVRRLTDSIELSLDQSLKWAVFQPNAEPLWANLRSEIGTYLAGLWVQGALQGQTQDQAFFVRADSSTTTPTDILQGICNVVIGIAPVKPAEFVILQFQLLAGQSAS